MTFITGHSNAKNVGKNKKPSKPPKAPLGEMPVGAPMDRLGTYFLGAFPETPRGNKFLEEINSYWL